MKSNARAIAIKPMSIGNARVGSMKLSPAQA
jgi:hypothetical protein